MILCVDIRTSVTEHLAHAYRKCGSDFFSRFAKVMYLVAGKIKNGFLPCLLAESVVVLGRWLRERAGGGTRGSAQRRCVGGLTCCLQGAAKLAESDDNRHSVTGRGGNAQMARRGGKL
ncbi:unnamed protein product [Ostreobium quekettii]|uniref:Uncharacterized protein n=1 Tax=Ostreobium quekettii TaxID=121088 RepID=A0A8S1J4R1_9CHLO|nr:unnamed protein product [Ostreobium quekettii]